MKTTRGKMKYSYYNDNHTIFKTSTYKKRNKVSFTKNIILCFVKLVISGIIIILVYIVSMIVIIHSSSVFSLSSMWQQPQQQQQQSTLLLSTSLSSSSTLYYVPIQHYYPCNGEIDQITCTLTIFIDEHDGSSNEFINTSTPMMNENDQVILMNHLCTNLKSLFQLQQNQQKSLCDSPNKVVQVPLCVQTYHSVGVLIYPTTETKKTKRNNQIFNMSHNSYTNIRFAYNIQDPPVQDFITNPATTSTTFGQAITKLSTTAADASIRNNNQKNMPEVRIIPLKIIDFPNYYFQLNDTSNKIVEKYRDTNYGNMVWRYGSSMLLNPITNYIHPISYENMTMASGGGKRFDQTKQNFDALVIACSNLIQLTRPPKLKLVTQMKTKRILERNVSTIVLGIGIQMEFLTKDTNASNTRELTTDLSLYYSFQKEFFHEIMKRQTIPAIGVRGDITKSVCKNSGIPNCVSMGCPSLTISRDMNLGNTLHSNWSRVTQILSLLQQRRQTLHKISKKVKIAVTFPKSIKSISGYIGAALIATLIEQSHYDIDNTTTIVIVTQHKMDHKRMEQFIRTRLEQFNPKSRLLLDKNDTIHNVIKYIEYVNVESWLADASVQYDLCISFRIHGSMTFISSGVPTIAIPTDFRIMELVQAMKLPYIVPELLSQLLNSYITNVNNNDSNGMNTLLLSSLMENAKNTNFTMFEMNRRQKIQGWKDILEDAGLEMDPALFRIIKSP